MSVFVIVIVLSLRFSNTCSDRFARGDAVKERQMEEKEGARAPMT